MFKIHQLIEGKSCIQVIANELVLQVSPKSQAHTPIIISVAIAIIGECVQITQSGNTYQATPTRGLNTITVTMGAQQS